MREEGDLNYFSLSDHGKYSSRLRLGEYSPIITSPSANNCLLLSFELVRKNVERRVQRSSRQPTVHLSY